MKAAGDGGTPVGRYRSARSMNKRSDAREKMVASAMKLQRMHGVTGTAFSDVIKHSGAPRGSIYHHFPGGRSELAAAATERGADWIEERLGDLLEGDDLLAAFDGFIEMWKEIVTEEDYLAGCAVAAGALDPESESPARDAARVGFRHWENTLTDACLRAGIGRDRAEGLAMTMIAAIEGALILVRAEGDMRPLDVVATSLRQLLSTELAQAG